MASFKRKTVKIVYGDSYAVINETYYDSSVHEIYVPPLEPVIKKSENVKKEVKKSAKKEITFSLEKNFD